MRNSLTGIALVGLLIAVPTVASAQAQPRQETTKESKDSKVARGDQHFMKEAAEGGMAEVQLGQLASQRASSDSVKQLASLAARTGRASLVSRSASSGRPMSQVELAFLTSPVTWLTTPGMPTPTEPMRPASASISATRRAIASRVPA